MAAGKGLRQINPTMAKSTSLPLRLLLLVSLLVGHTFAASDAIPKPGNPALLYQNGSFSVPDGTVSSFAQGTVLNVSWETSYSASDLYLFKNEDWSNGISISVNSQKTWFDWTVSTDSKNDSDIYVLRVVDGHGTQVDKLDGGFLSAQFYITQLDNDVSTTSSVSTTSLASPTTSSATATSTTSTSATVALSSPTSATTSAAAKDDTGTSLGTMAKLGIGIGIGLGLLGACGLGLGVYLLRKSRKATPGAAAGGTEAERTSMMGRDYPHDPPPQQPPMSYHEEPTKGVPTSPSELGQGRQRHELYSPKPVYEMGA